MKVLCIKKNCPDEGDGYASEHYLAITEKHFWYVDLYYDWESGNGVDEYNIEISDDLFIYSIDEVGKYIENKDNETDDEYGETSIGIGLIEMSEEDFSKLNLLKNSVLTNLVESNVTSFYNPMELGDDMINNCLAYLLSYFDLQDLVGCEDEKEEIAENILNNK